MPEIILLATPSGESSFAINLGKVVAIVGTEPTTCNGVIYRGKKIGFELKNLLVKSDKSDNYIDINGVMGNTRTVVSFGELGSQYMRDSDEILVCLKTKWTGIDCRWLPDELMYAYLHEYGHAFISQYENEHGIRDKAPKERNANAVALNIARWIRNAYPDENFIDIELYRIWIEEQLQGYDPDKIDNGISSKRQSAQRIAAKLRFPYVASSTERKKLRQIIRKGSK